MPTKRPDGRWMKMVTVGLDADGKLVRKAVYGKTKAEAKTKADALEKQSSPSSFYVDPNKIMLTEWLYEWLETVAKGRVRTNTWESYEGVIRVHLAPAFVGLALSKLQPHAIRRFYTDKLNSGLSGRTVQYMHTVLNAALKQAVIDEILTRNPCDAVRKPQKTKKEIKPLDQDQINILLKAANKHRLHPLFLLDWATGLRRSELLGLRWQDLNLKQGTLSVNQTIMVTKNGLEFSEPKSKTSRRTITIPIEVVRELQSHRARQAELRLRTGFHYQPYDLVFAREDGHPIDPRGLSQQFKNLIKKAGLPETVRLHDLRHTHATQLMLMGEHLIKAQHRMGHATIQQTAEYTHLVPNIKIASSRNSPLSSTSKKLRKLSSV